MTRSLPLLTVLILFFFIPHAYSLNHSNSHGDNGQYGLFPLSAKKIVKPVIQTQDTISLLIEGPSSAIYTAWGHIAIRIKQANGLDMTYSFGTFDFNTSNFYLKFIQGSLFYTGSIVPFSLYRQSELEEPHYIVEQVLNLDSNQKNVIINELARLSALENRFYKYDFLYVNCSTKIRDVLVKALSPQSLYSTKRNPDARTFRQELRPYTIEKPWLEFGIDLVLGMPTDKRINDYESAFLPLNLFSLNKKVLNHDGKPLVLTERVISRPNESKQATGIKPVLVFSVLLIAIILLSFIKNTGRIIDLMLFPITGLIGIVLFYLSFVSEHTATQHNLNLFWALPTHLVFLLLKPKTKYIYSLANLFICALFLAGWSIIPQYLNPAVAPILLILFYRFLVSAGLNNVAKEYNIN